MMTMYCATCVPVNRAHAVQERADQNTRQADEYADVELEAGKPGGDDADAANLRHYIGEGADNRRECANQADEVSAIACAQEIGNSELAKLAQKWRQK